MNEKRIDLPENVNVPLWDKVKVRALMSHENVRYNIMIKQGNTRYAPRNETRNLPSISHQEVWMMCTWLMNLNMFRHFRYNGKTIKILLLWWLTHHPTPIVGMEVSARWKRTWKGEVIMTIIIPNDVVDTEVYIKTSRGHAGIKMDPWMSCTWRRTWNFTHPPNTQTKEKLRKYKLQKAAKRLVYSGLLVNLDRWETATSHPDQKADVMLTPILRKEPLPLTRISSLPKATSPTILPKHCWKRRDREKITLMALLQTVPLQTLTMNNQTW